VDEGLPEGGPPPGLRRRDRRHAGAWDAKEKKRPLDYWKFLAVDSLRPLHDLVNKASSNFGKVPYLTYDQAADAYGVFKISGPSVLLDAVKLDDFFVGLSPALPLFTYRQAKKRAFSSSRPATTTTRGERIASSTGS
jgi:hypothetical protein